LEEAERLKNELPTHLANAMEFALQTGLRESNITRLEWSEVDFERCHAFIPASKSKSGKAIAVPLNSKVIDVIRRQVGKHLCFVFTYKGQPITRFNNKAWRKALKELALATLDGMIFATRGHHGMCKMVHHFKSYNSLGDGQVLRWCYVTRT
jgi:integrase